MNFDQALEKMIFGHRVRLSDWTGYWYLPTPPNPSTSGWNILDYIRVFTRDGDILDSANIDRYKDRIDWEVVTEIGFSFDMALRFLKNGKRVERTGWNGKGIWIQRVGGGTFSMDHEVYDATAYLQIKSVNGTVTPWLPSQTDLLSNDWQIVNG